MNGLTPESLTLVFELEELTEAQVNTPGPLSKIYVVEVAVEGEPRVAWQIYFTWNPSADRIRHVMAFRASDGLRKVITHGVDDELIIVGLGLSSMDPLRRQMLVPYLTERFELFTDGVYATLEALSDEDQSANQAIVVAIKNYCREASRES